MYYILFKFKQRTYFGKNTRISNYNIEFVFIIHITSYLIFIMRNHLLLFGAICCVFVFHTQSQIKSGLLFQGGSGVIKAVIEPAYLESILAYDIHYKSNFDIGYRFQIKQAGTVLFYNFDAKLGMKLWQTNYYMENQENEPSNPYDNMLSKEESTDFYLASLSASVNYSIYQGLNAGIGLEPVFLITHIGANHNFFDMPLVVSLAYNLGPVELGIIYKYGFFNLIKSDYIQSGKFRDLQLSLFIPF